MDRKHHRSLIDENTPFLGGKGQNGNTAEQNESSCTFHSSPVAASVPAAERRNAFRAGEFLGPRDRSDGVILRVGLTGGIASGKSTILRLFGERGCITADADAIVARLYEPGQPGHAAIVRTYGAAVLQPDGTIDRRKLADVAFSSPEQARQLNALIHPIVIDEQTRLMADAEAADDDAIYVIEATLLLESGGRERYDRIVVVDVDPAVQVARGVARGMAEPEVRRRIANQMPREERLRHADYVIDNSGDERQARSEVDRVYNELARDLRERKSRDYGVR